MSEYGIEFVENIYSYEYIEKHPLPTKREYEEYRERMEQLEKEKKEKKEKEVNNKTISFNCEEKC